MNKILAGLQIIAEYDEDFMTCAEHDIIYAMGPGPSKDNKEEPVVTNCARCDVSFDDYPEMRTKGTQCSTCAPNESVLDDDLVDALDEHQATLMSGEDSKKMDELNWTWNGESWEHFT